MTQIMHLQNFSEKNQMSDYNHLTRIIKKIENRINKRGCMYIRNVM